MCIWTNATTDHSDTWETECGKMFTLNEGSPSDNDMKFCCYCGGSLEEERFSNLEEEAEEDAAD